MCSSKKDDILATGRIRDLHASFASRKKVKEAWFPSKKPMVKIMVYPCEPKVVKMDPIEVVSQEESILLPI